MALEAKLVQKLSQSLLMTPQLQQAIKLLQLGRLEYIDAVQQELLENPILEELRTDENDATPDTSSSDPRDARKEEPKKKEESPIDWEQYLESLSDYRGASTPKNFSDFDDRPPLEATLTREQTLREYLVEQLRMNDLTLKQKKIATEILGNLDRNGILLCEYQEIADNTLTTIPDIEQVVELLKELDPPGIAARNVQECLLFQLESAGFQEDLAYRIVHDHLGLIEKRKFSEIAKLENVSLDLVSAAMKLIQSLEPRPGRRFADEETRYITPDIYVTKVDDEYVITLNEDGLPRLRVSPYYLELLKKAADDPTVDKGYLHDKLKSASWFIKSIHQRQQTIYKVTESIVKFQRAFLDHGIAQLKPMVLKDVADDISMHESTVSRVTTNKYVHTPQGVFELKFFFTTAIRSSGGGSDVSSSAVKERIRLLIQDEDTKNPLSDQQIVELLKGEQIKIARRTVAKYREGLGIPSSSQRKSVLN